MRDEHLLTGDDTYSCLVTEFGMLRDALHENLSSHSVQQWYVMLCTLELRVRTAFHQTSFDPGHSRWQCLYTEVDQYCARTVPGLFNGLFPDLGRVKIPWHYNPKEEIRVLHTRLCQSWMYGDPAAEEELNRLVELVREEVWNSLARRGPVLSRLMKDASEAARVTRNVTVQFRPDHPLGPYALEIPAGLRVTPIPVEGTQEPGWYFLDEFPESIFPRGSITRHDAEHYGVRLSYDQTKEA